MRLYLVQHGQALPAEVDPERPLSPAGEAEVGRIATLLGDAGLKVGRILHSGKRRAEQTARRLAARLDPEHEPAARAGLDPNDPVEPVAREIESWSEATMLVGHLPFMARLASRLVSGRADAGVVAFQPGSVLALERTDRGWTIAWMIRPELVAGRP